MKIQYIVSLLLVVGYLTVSAQTTNALTDTNTPSSSRHLTEVQVLALAKPILPLGPNEGYFVQFRSNVWVVAAEPIKNGRGYYGVMTIRDSDGKVLEVTNRLFGVTTYSDGLPHTNLESHQGHSL
jgi:hypothetical protein